MKPEEAIKLLKSIKLGMPILPYGGSQRFIALDSAIEALEKQMPKKPELVGKVKLREDLIIDEHRCPACEWTGVSEYPYCPVCGQAIDWSEPE